MDYSQHRASRAVRLNYLFASDLYVELWGSQLLHVSTIEPRCIDNVVVPIGPVLMQMVCANNLARVDDGPCVK